MVCENGSIKVRAMERKGGEPMGTIVSDGFMIINCEG